MKKCDMYSHKRYSGDHYFHLTDEIRTRRALFTLKVHRTTKGQLLLLNPRLQAQVLLIHAVPPSVPPVFPLSSYPFLFGILPRWWWPFGLESPTVFDKTLFFFMYHLLNVYGMSIPKNILWEMLHCIPNDIENKWFKGKFFAAYFTSIT